MRMIWHGNSQYINKNYCAAFLFSSDFHGVGSVQRGIDEKKQYNDQARSGLAEYEMTMIDKGASMCMT